MDLNTMDLNTMHPNLEPSTPVFTISQDPITPHMDTVSSYIEDTPIDKLDMSPQVIIQTSKSEDEVEQIDTEMIDPGRPGSSSSDTSTDRDSVHDAPVEIYSDSATTYTEAQLASIKLEWVGTSQILDQVNVEMQLRPGMLDGIIACLMADFDTLKTTGAYDPVAYVEIGTSLNRIGFTDIGAGYVNRALILIRAGLGLEKLAYIPGIKKRVIKAMQHRLGGFSQSKLIIEDELNSTYIEAYLTLLDSLMGCSAYWDGLLVAKEALDLFPGHPDILEMRDVLKNGLQDYTKYLTSQGLQEEVRGLSRTGKVFNKQYPWLKKELFYRTPALLRDINQGLLTRGFGGYSNCEVRPVVFGAKLEEPKKVGEGEDVGPCGVFATRDIKAGEPVIIDRTVVGLSDVLPSTFEHCEACHGFIYLLVDKPIIPACCKKVAYCSVACAETAASGYHKAVCGKDTEYPYKLEAKGQSHNTWRTIIFQRAVAVVLGDRVNGTNHNHPLQHPLMARITASYFMPKEGDIQPPTPQDFLYTEYIVAPTRILLNLGVDVFASDEWSPEILRTMIMRLDNNANQSNVVTLPGRKPIRTINVNPQYIFLNHSCEPNVYWGSTPEGYSGNGKDYRLAESTVFCHAIQDIKKDDELFISYVGDPLGKRHDANKTIDVDQDSDVFNMSREENRLWMAKWFDNGCGCKTCERENRERAALEERVAAELADLDLNV